MCKKRTKPPKKFGVAVVVKNSYGKPERRKSRREAKKKEPSTGKNTYNFFDGLPGVGLNPKPSHCVCEPCYDRHDNRINSADEQSKFFRAPQFSRSIPGIRDSRDCRSQPVLNVGRFKISHIVSFVPLREFRHKLARGCESLVS